MPGGILKRENALQGQEVTLGARVAATAPAAPSIKGQPGPAGVEAATPTAAPVPKDQARRDASTAVEQIKAHAQQHASELVAEAAQTADTLRAEAEAEAARLREAAEASITERQAQLDSQVRAAVAKEYQERYLKALQVLEQAAADIQKHQADYLAAIEQPAFALVLAIARQVLGRELADPVASLPALIAQAFQLLQPQQPLKVYLAPATFQQLTESELFADALARAGVRLERIELEIDGGLGEGQFRAESGGSYIKCDLPALLDAATSHLSAQAKLNHGEDA